MSSATWWQAARPLAHANIAIPLLLGQAVAVAHGASFDPVACALAHAFGVLVHLFIVFANDVADEPADRAHAAPTILSGGSRVLVQGKLDARALRAAAIAAAVAMLALSGWMAFAHARPLAPWASAAAMLLVLAYSFDPLRLSYAGGGELAQGLGTGIVLPALGYYLQAGELPAFTALVPVLAFGVAGNIATALPDEPWDRESGKRSWPVRAGPLVARKHCLLLTALGILGAPLLVPELSQRLLLVCELPALAVRAWAAASWRDADPRRRQACVGFVLRCTGAANVAMLSWCVVAFLG